METKDAIRAFRTKKGLSQDELAEKVFVTRQAVSRWETGETVPSTDTLKELSRVLDVSMNALLGSPRTLICQCCGMPLEEDNLMSREPDGAINEEYCKWCYAEGKFVYQDLETLVDFLTGHMAGETVPPEQVHAYLEKQLPKLRHWQKIKKINICTGSNFKSETVDFPGEIWYTIKYTYISGCMQEERECSSMKR